MSKWSKNVVEHLENNCFHNNNEVLNRESDKYYQKLISSEIVLGSNQVIIDFGCGTARQLELNMIDKENYIGFDTSDSMLEKAKEKFPEHDFINTWSGYGNVDLVICNDVLQHVSSLDEFKNLLKSICNMGNIIILHFWYDKDTTKHTEVKIYNETFSEFFISEKDLEDALLEINNKNVSIRYFRDEKPYPCVVVQINQSNEQLENNQEIEINTLIEDNEDIF